MATSTNNEYEVTKPQQQRAIETTNRILEAAYDIVAFDGYQALTTNSVAERAGVNIRSVYIYFEDKNDIILHLAQKERDTRALAFGWKTLFELRSTFEWLTHGQILCTRFFEPFLSLQNLQGKPMRN